MRFALAQFWHESNMFTRRRTTLNAFRENEYLFGEEIIDSYRGLRTQVGGMIDAAREFGVELVPVLAVRDAPGPIMTAETFRAVRQDFNTCFAAVGAVDAVCLSFHGSACAEDEFDPEGVLLRDLRALFGREMPIAVTLDIHANLSHDMIANATGLFGSNVYPEVDGYERGREAIDFLVRVVRGELRPVVAHRYLPMLAQSTRQYTGADPALSVLRLSRSLEENPELIDCTFYYGYPDADVPFLGTHVVAIANGSRRLAEEAAQKVADALWQARAEFAAVPPDPEMAVRQALEGEGFPVVIAESSDNPGGGSAGDATSLLRAMLARAPEILPAAFASIADPETVLAAQQAGIGKTFAARLGGKSPDAHSPPVEVEARVKRLTDGEYVLSGPFQTGRRESMGPTALLDVRGIDVVVSSRPRQIFDEEPFRLHGVSVRQCRVVGIKSTVHFRAHYESVASRIFVTSGPGPFHHSVRPRRYTRPPQPLWLG